MKEPLVSVIINCYNCELYLKEAIDSVYNQSYSDWEIIFWDNCSTDKSGEIAMMYDDKLKYFLSENHTTLAKARYAAVGKAQGKYIAFLDADDVWLNKKLEKQLTKICTGPYSLCYTGMFEQNIKGERIRTIIPTYPDGNMLKHLLKQFDIGMSTMMIDKNFLENSGINFDETIYGSEDYNIALRLAAVSEFCIVREPLSIWRVHSNSLTSKIIDKWSIERIGTLNRIILEHPEAYEQNKKYFKEAFARGNYYQARYLINCNERKLALKEMKTIINASYIYMLLYYILLFSPKLWNFIHDEERKRKITFFLLKFIKN